MHYQLVVIGGGAAGFFCAVNAARLHPGLSVCIVEKSSKVLQKVKVSGGGRCNVTHSCFEIAAMAKRYPRGEKFLKKAFHHFFTTDTIDWFQSRSVALKTEEDGRMFPVTDNSQTIIDCLLKEADKYHVELKLRHGVEAINWTGEHWSIDGGGEQLTADRLCVACGGFPKASMFGWLTTATGHTIAEPVPSLFTFNLPSNSITQLMGVAVPKAQVKIAGTKLQSDGPVLITHWGLSGPAVLRLSAFAALDLASKNYSYTLIVNWLPNFNENSLREKILLHRQQKSNQKITNTEWITLPSRLLEYIASISGADSDTRWGDLSAAVQHKLIKNLCGMELVASGKTTYKDEFVTAGGIQLSEIDVNTMAGKLKPNLYFAGEILNIDGITGGFNFQNAWTTAFIAATAIAAATKPAG